MKLNSCYYFSAVTSRACSIVVAAGVAASSAILTSETAMAEEGKTITTVMHSALRVLDPVITTAYITRNHGYMIYDVLIAMDEKFEIHPQMADFAVSDDGLTYKFSLREGLLFHDGDPVTATDVVASLERWGERDSGGQMIFDVTKSLEASDERTVNWILSEPFMPFLDVLGKQSSIPAFIMPERVAKTSSDEAITDYTGSGPFVFVEEEFQPGVSVTYTRFDDYLPREEPANGMSGGKVVNVDTVKWIAMPDSHTAINALLSGEIDYIEQVQIDLLSLLDSNENVFVEVRDPLGYQTFGRMNFKHPPFDNQQIRQAALLAMDQEAFLAALIGNPNYYSVCGAVFGCGTPYESEAGAETLLAGGDPEAARDLLDEAGYDGTPIVMLQPTDVANLRTQPVVAAQLLREVGFNVDLQPMDWQSVVTRRANRGPVSEGGWNMFFSGWSVADITSPISNMTITGRGDDSYWGWPEDPVVEALRSEYIAADTPEARAEIADRIQAHVLEFVHYIPVGQYDVVQARRANIVDMIPAPFPVFWQVDKIK